MSTTNLTVLEVATRANTSRNTIYRAIRNGQLAVVKFGPRSIRVPEDELAAYIARNSVPARVEQSDGAA